ncbi:MAG: threonylcarbamoyl-AMP synthase [Bacteroidales bacterium]|jgi:L-threonylcarbamoyladenylate synthase|nr:threonylcarbamoyl-AMP synthase [Bacteroidales bacterium]NPV37042.1 threonylcarbamoyl-AMP synthase [Bacteroidales bacterium]
MSTDLSYTPFFYDDVRLAVDALKKGGVILYPTDTIWGLGCLADHVPAINRIYQIKQRYEKKSFIILVDSVDMLKRYVAEVPPVALDLIESYQKPLTIVYQRARNLPAVLVADDSTIAIRVIKHPFCQEVIKAINVPLVSTSANVSGFPPAPTFSAISEEIKSKVDYIAMTDRDRLNKPSPSTIIRILPSGDFETLRD